MRERKKEKGRWRKEMRESKGRRGWEKEIEESDGRGT